ncbi:hypothetical protein [Paracoccus yeei]|uniref:hypothetical protein n=1 Tax=Paracoccus yeei TaxID=147645 RepID=UPI0011B0537F|nr:hypothetical protein [Paracoccus yeei]
MGLHRRPEIAGFLAKAYETLQFKANKTASSAHKINALRVVQAGLVKVSAAASCGKLKASSAAALVAVRKRAIIIERFRTLISL